MNFSRRHVGGGNHNEDKDNDQNYGVCAFVTVMIFQVWTSIGLHVPISRDCRQGMILILIEN